MPIISKLRNNWPFVLLAVLSLIGHFIFLGRPSAPVFDEIHFGKFISNYFTGQYYFDIHPPLGKLIIAGFAKLANFKAGFDFAQIGEAGPKSVFLTLRFMPALFGTLFVLLIAWFAYLLTRSKAVSLLAGFLILLDNAFLIQSRFILIDIFLVFFEILSLCFFLLWQRSQKIIFMVLTGLSFGLTISIKWTGLAVLAIIVLILIWRKKIREIIFIALIGFLIYLLPFAVHFSLLNKNAPQGPFFEKFISLNKQMFLQNCNFPAEHPSGSRFYQWPVDLKNISYIYIEKTGVREQIDFTGNLFLWWLAGFSVIFAVLSRDKKSSLLLLGFFCNWLPFIFIKRSSFLYHYLPAVMFAIILLAIYLDSLLKKDKKLALVILTLIVLNFLIFLPFTYAIPLP